MTQKPSYGVCSTSLCCLKTEIGLLEIACCRNGVHSIHISEEEENKDVGSTFFDLKSADFKCMDEITNWLKDYFWFKTFRQPPSICPTVFYSKGEFTSRVWTTLSRSVPAGSTVTYGRLASLCGRDGAARAVGTAMRRNPVPLLVPCHRVVKSGGGLGRYSGGGTRVKEWLLRHEGARIP